MKAINAHKLFYCLHWHQVEVVSDPILSSNSLNVLGGGDTLQDSAVSCLLKMVSLLEHI